jgi:hypothetical protein
MTRDPDCAKVPGAHVGPDGSTASPPVEFARVASFREFGELAYPGEALEVYVPSTVEWLEATEVDACLACWVDLLARGGTLSVSGTDLPQLCEAVALGKLGDREANRLLYAGRKACYSAATIAGALESRGLVVRSVRLGRFDYTVAAERVH